MSRLFPVNNGVRKGDGVSLAVAIILYVLAMGVVGVVSRLLWWVPLLGWAIGVVSSLVGIYCIVGIILAVIRFAS